MQVKTLCLLIRGDSILMAMKKRGFGVGKWNGYGGRVEKGESIVAAAVRELDEESKICISETALEKVAIATFRFAEVPEAEVHVFIVRDWKGEALETEEMCPQWFALDQIPYDQMWIGDTKWLPLVLEGKCIDAVVDYNQDGDQILDFHYREKDFLSGE